MRPAHPRLRPVRTRRRARGAARRLGAQRSRRSPVQPGRTGVSRTGGGGEQSGGLRPVQRLRHRRRTHRAAARQRAAPRRLPHLRADRRRDLRGAHRGTGPRPARAQGRTQRQRPDRGLAGGAGQPGLPGLRARHGRHVHPGEPAVSAAAGRGEGRHRLGRRGGPRLPRRHGGQPGAPAEDHEEPQNPWQQRALDRRRPHGDGAGLPAAGLPAGPRARPGRRPAALHRHHDRPAVRDGADPRLRPPRTDRHLLRHLLRRLRCRGGRRQRRRRLGHGHRRTARRVAALGVLRALRRRLRARRGPAAPARHPARRHRPGGRRAGGERSRA